MPVVLVGTLDTKGEEIRFARDAIAAAGLETIVVDAGTVGSPAFAPDIDRARVLDAAGLSIAELQARGDRGESVAAAARGIAQVVADLCANGHAEGILALGGSAGTTIGTAAMRAAPFGMPKVMVSTLASGQTRPYVGGSDIAMFASVADVAGLNRITTTVIANAAAALAGMVHARRARPPEVWDRPLVTATMFGVTTPCVDRARRVLEGKGCEVVVFHATGVGGQAMEGLVRDRQVQGVLDLTTTELADELVGGVLSAGPDRLEAAVRSGVPQVVSLGALDMVNFGPMATVPEKFRQRKLHVHNPSVTLMRTTPDENRRLGEWLARVLGRASGRTVVLIPRGGVSALDAPGKSFHDPESDAALFEGVRSGLADAANPLVSVVVREEHINDVAFAEFAAESLWGLMRDQSSKDQ
jgi:uncharacterized protein (UPF0261 family)